MRRLLLLATMLAAVLVPANALAWDHCGTVYAEADCVLYPTPTAVPTYPPTATPVPTYAPTATPAPTYAPTSTPLPPTATPPATPVPPTDSATVAPATVPASTPTTVATSAPPAAPAVAAAQIAAPGAPQHFTQYCHFEPALHRWEIRLTTNSSPPGERPVAPGVCDQHLATALPTAATALPPAATVTSTAVPAVILVPRDVPEAPVAMPTPTSTPQAQACIDVSTLAALVDENGVQAKLDGMPLWFDSQGNVMAGAACAAPPAIRAPTAPPNTGDGTCANDICILP